MSREKLAIRSSWVVGVLVAAVEALEVEDREAAELADRPRRIGRDDAVERGREQRQIEAVRTERPGDVDVVGVARAARRNDGDLVESVRPTGLLSASDLYFHCGRVRAVRTDVEVAAATIGPLDASSAPALPDLPGAAVRDSRPVSRSRRRARAARLDLGEQPVDPTRIDQPGAEMLGRLRPAGDAEAQAVDRRAARIAGGDVAGEKRVARADGGARLLLLDPDAVECRARRPRGRGRSSRRSTVMIASRGAQAGSSRRPPRRGRRRR